MKRATQILKPQLMLVFFAIVLTNLSQTLSTAIAQDAKPKEGFEWLMQFEGNWKSESKASDKNSNFMAGTFTARPFGKMWMVCEHDADMGSMKFKAIQRVGYDPETKRFVGSWFDSVSQHVWKYDGELNEAGDTLTLNARGPDWNDPSKTKDYRDMYQIKTPKHIATTSQIKNDAGQWETFMSGSLKKQDGVAKTTVTPFLMFIGRANEAIEFYQTVFPGTKVLSMQKYGPDGPGKEGTVQLAEILIAGQRVKMIDSPAIHDFDFTPSFSFFVECENNSQIQTRFTKLSKDGKVMMPLDDYGFSKRFGWTSDKFGVSWQLNLQ